MTTARVTLAPATADGEPQQYSRAAYLQLGLVVSIWAVNWVFVKAALDRIAVVPFTAIRFTASAVVLALIASICKQPILPARGERLGLAIIGLLQVAGLIGLGTIALQYTTVGRGTVLSYTMQLWALPIGWLFTRERIKPLALAGGLVGFTGIVLFLNPLLVNWHDHPSLFGNALMLETAINWAVASCLYRRRQWRTPFWTQTFWQLAWSALVMSVAAVFLRPARSTVWSAWIVALLMFNCIFASGLCYWLWGKALSVMPAPRAGQIVSLIPVFALLLSAIFLGERVSIGAVASMVVIGFGLFLTLRSR
jgi:drug/metabolite transporter (DMT)-like permease